MKILFCTNILIQWLVLISILWSSAACKEILPHSEILSIEGQPEVFLINGEADAGYTVQMKVRNNGQTGTIRLEVKLTCSEGDFVREREVHFDVGETKTIAFSFHEPTINARDVQFQGLGWP